MPDKRVTFTIERPDYSTLLQEKNELIDMVKELNDKLHELQGILQSAQDKSILETKINYEKEVQLLKSQLQKQKEENKQLEKVVKETKTEINELAEKSEKELNNLNLQLKYERKNRLTDKRDKQEMQLLQSQLKSIEEENKTMEKVVNETNFQMESLTENNRKEMQLLQNQLQKLQEENKKLEGVASETKLQMESMTEKYRKEVDYLNLELQNKHDNSNRVKDTVAEQEIQLLQSQLQKQTEDYKMLERAVSESKLQMNHQTEKFKKALDNLNLELTCEQENSHRLKTDNKRAEQEMQLLQNKLKSIEEENKTMEKVVNETNFQMESLTEKNRKEMQLLQNQLQKLQEENKKLEGAASETKIQMLSMIEKYRKEVDYLNLEVQNKLDNSNRVTDTVAEQEIQLLQSQLQKQKEDYKMLETAVSKSKLQMNHQTEKSKKALDNLNQELQIERENSNSAKHEIQSLVNQLHNLKIENQELERAVYETNDLTEKYEQELNNLKLKLQNEQENSNRLMDKRAEQDKQLLHSQLQKLEGENKKLERAFSETKLHMESLTEKYRKDVDFLNMELQSKHDNSNSLKDTGAEQEIQLLQSLVQKQKDDNQKMEKVVSETKLQMNHQSEKSKKAMDNLNLELTYEQENSHRLKTENKRAEQEMQLLHSQLQKLQEENKKLEGVASETKLQMESMTEKYRKEVDYLNLELQKKHDNSNRVMDSVADQEIQLLQSQLQKQKEDNKKLEIAVSETKLQMNHQTEKSKKALDNLNLELTYERDNSNRLKDRLRRMQSSQLDATICLKSKPSNEEAVKKSMVDKTVMTNVKDEYLDDQRLEKMAAAFERGNF